MLYGGILEDFFARNPQIHHCATLASKAHIVGEFLLDTGRSNVQIMGYDLVGKNVRVRFDVNAREYQGKWFNSIRGYAIEEA